MGIVDVAHLETCTVTRQTARTQRRHSALVCNLSKRIGLVHELRQRVGAKICIDNRRYGLRVNKVNRSEHLVVAHIHTLTDSAGHTRKPDAELIVELFADSTYTTVAQVVDIIDIRFGIDKFYQVLDNGYDILLRQYLDVFRHIERQLLVDTIAPYVTEVVSLFREEQVSYHLARTCVIRWLGVAQLTIDIMYSLFLRVTCIFL